ncbi:uncharacterized protein LOC112541579 [Python bivittatus]|uniref:Uncharacterized protein LOC112541579 n=1 Tax=Python bivittatus TaxID=176946 RepID=A0A9F5IV95_PYTBI|nr:uncharacterized protein LOC112541579 [Python bivittatus]
MGRCSPPGPEWRRQSLFPTPAAGEWGWTGIWEPQRSLHVAGAADRMPLFAPSSGRKTSKGILRSYSWKIPGSLTSCSTSQREISPLGLAASHKRQRRMMGRNASAQHSRPQPLATSLAARVWAQRPTLPPARSWAAPAGCCAPPTMRSLRARARLPGAGWA